MDDILKIVGASVKPKKITQKVFEYDSNNAHIVRLCELNNNAKPSPGDLYDYIQDIKYGDEIQKDLLKFLLPICLSAWREYLVNNNESYVGYIEEFSSFLAEKELYPAILSKAEYESVIKFYANSILDRMDCENKLYHKGMGATPYKWVSSLGSYCVIFPDLKYVWEHWWDMKTEGRILCIVQYISCLMYDETSNPIFAPWTSNEGGGPPLLWECDGNIFNKTWKTGNIEFIKSILTKDYVYNSLVKACQMLRDDENKAITQKMVNAFQSQKEILKYHIKRLPEVVSKSVNSLSWDD